MSDTAIPPSHPPLHLSTQRYLQLLKQSTDDPERFWAEQAAKRLTFFKPYQHMCSGSFQKGNIRWFEGGQLNACYLCLDTQLTSHANQPAFIWEGNEPEQQRTLSYHELHQQVCQLANALRDMGIKKGDRVCLYMPLIPEAAIAMLACARIGAIHAVVFAGFSEQSLKQRIIDCQASCLITATGCMRGSKWVDLHAIVKNTLSLLEECNPINHVIIVQQNEDSPKQPNHFIDYHQLIANQATTCEPEWMDAEDPLFILYTSGSTGTPKGVVHTTAGYLLYVATTFEIVFDYRPKERFWCTADVGWITGHSYVVYGPLLNAATSVMYGGIPTYPDPSRYWEIIDRHQINIFYTAPTAIRALMREGEQPLQSTQRDSLRLLGSVGEPINPDVWLWFYNHVGRQKCDVVDTWWQTETGGIMISALPGLMPMKPGAAMRPFLGIQAELVDEDNNPITDQSSGRLIIKQPWPGIARTIYGDHQRYIKTYLSDVPGCYMTGDGATQDSDGDYWISGRIDDVLNVSGHRLGTAEIESALLKNDGVAEAAVVGFPHDIKGEGIYAFITIKAGMTINDDLKKTLIKTVRHEIGPIATIDHIHWAPALPKTRSGKIMRRILRKLCCGDHNFGDTSTLANPEVIEELIQTITWPIQPHQ